MGRGSAAIIRHAAVASLTIGIRLLEGSGHTAARDETAGTAVKATAVAAVVAAVAAVSRGSAAFVVRMRGHAWLRSPCQRCCHARTGAGPLACR